MKPNVAIVAALWIVMIGLFVMGLLVQVCSAQSDDETVLALTQCLVAECDRCDRGEEKAAIAWVLWKGMKRYNVNPRNKKKRSFKDQIKAYCVLWNKRSKYYDKRRARSIRASNLQRQYHLHKCDWNRIERFVTDFLSGRILDPHPTSRHFNGGKGAINKARKKGLRLLGKYCNRAGKWCTYIFG